MQIFTDLPSAEENFDNCQQPTLSLSLQDAMSPTGAAQLSPLAGVIVMSCLIGRNLTHLHRPGTNEDEGNLQGEFWKRHRQLDNVLLTTAMSLPTHLRLPAGVQDPNTVFLNMCVHTSIICLHQAAIFKADSHGLAPHVAAESKIRCLSAAAETASIMRLICHQDLRIVSPAHVFLSW